MNKKQLVEWLAKNAGFESKVQAERVVDALFGHIKGMLVLGKEVSVSGFGKFVVRNRAARTGRNPKTGAPVEIAAAKKVKFRPGKELKEAVR